MTSVNNTCVCHLLNNKNIIISNNIFHSNICNLHKIYLKKYTDEQKIFINTNNNFFCEFIEYNCTTKKIRDVTIIFLIEHSKKIFDIK